MNLFEKIIEAIFWLRIAASPIAAAFFIGGVLYLNDPDVDGPFWFWAILIAGVILGIVLALTVTKKESASQFMSRAIATPDPDRNRDEEKKEKSKEE